jgi:tRNA (mo5U34)-methyltransferase
MDPAELQERIASFPRWHYEFEFEGGVRTPVSHRGQAVRHERRRGYFFEPLLAALGGTLAGHRVLDLGCNAGYWSLAAVQAGADYVLGIDAREQLVEQANLVFEAKAIERSRYRFEHANVFDHTIAGRFDVVLCLGMFEVTCKPVELFELMRGVGAEIVLLDTTIARFGASLFEMSRLADPRAAVEHQLVLIPTREAVRDLAEAFGYHTTSLAYNFTDYEGLDDYKRGRRLAFVCSRSPSLDGLAQAPPQSAPGRLLAAARSLIAQR